MTRQDMKYASEVANFTNTCEYTIRGKKSDILPYIEVNIIIYGSLHLIKERFINFVIAFVLI